MRRAKVEHESHFTIRNRLVTSVVFSSFLLLSFSSNVPAKIKLRMLHSSSSFAQLHFTSGVLRFSLRSHMQLHDDGACGGANKLIPSSAAHSARTRMSVFPSMFWPEPSPPSPQNRSFCVCSVISRVPVKSNSLRRYSAWNFDRRMRYIISHRTSNQSGLSSSTN